MKKVIFIMILLVACEPKTDQNSNQLHDLIANYESGQLKLENDSLCVDSIGNGSAVEQHHIVKFHYKSEQVLPKTQARVLQSSYVKNTPGSMTIGSPLNPKEFEEKLIGMKTGGKRTYLVPRNQNLYQFTVEVLSTKESAKPWELDNTVAKETSSGLKYIIVDEGNGKRVKTGETVNVHYSGYLMDYQKFDSSVDKGNPLEVTVDQTSVIKGWHEGLKLMNHSGKARLIIPPDLAYGNNPAYGKLSGAWLIFDVEIQ